MKLLLDTHVFLWALMAPENLSPSVYALLEDDDTGVFVSAASAWEISTKYRLGKLPGAARVVADYSMAISGLQAEPLPITTSHALKAGLWSAPHRDPFDRMLAAQAAIESLPLATTDRAMRQFGVQLLW
ncbi:type II toxin-antitoxin system VapC family toxin [Nitrococcus mobilis]|uniref:PIN domain-containing protein n=1 Tax=Nitrococcus mobilis Nb-231 TaxID=314278 RepID=A4BVI6_9GAMM|nr:type II toxin-antitoxin system VapC family toxin [Nitrococcus mobilis]EAR20251.1 hypothetical protein NB231_12881 [Nitrococcus mobilis Nb-231]